MYFGVVDDLGLGVSFWGNRRLKIRKSAWVAMPSVFLSIVCSIWGVAQASSPGLTATYYDNRPNGYNQYNNAPPLPSVSGNPSVGTELVSRVQQNFDQYPPFGLYEDFIVHYEGYVTSPVSGSFRFWPQADDGTKLYINDVLVQNDWRDKGGGGALSSYVTFEAGVSQKFEMWFYENGGGAWTTLYWDIGSGWEVVPDSAFTTTYVAPTTTLAPYLNTPRNLQVTSVTDSSVSLSWDAPETSNADVERYAVMWSCENNWDASYGIASYSTEATITGLDSATSCIFQIRADNDTIPVYSDWSQSASGVTTSTTTTTSTSTTSTTSTTTTTEPVTTTTEPETTSTSVFVFPTIPPDTTPQEETVAGTIAPETTEAPILQQTEQPETTTTTDAPEIITEATTAIDNLDTTDISASELSNVVSDVLDKVSSADELGAVVNDLLDKPLTDEQFSAVIDEVFSQPLSTEELTNVLEAVFDEPLSNEKFDEVISQVLDQPLSDEQFAAVVDILENDSITAEQVSSAVDAVLEAGVTEDQATELATSAKVLESIDGEQATEIFDTVDISAVTPEEAAQIVEAVQDAPSEVRNAFEEEINVFDGAVDTYVPLGSAVDVKTRRVVIAAVTAATSITMTPAPGAPSPSSGGSGGAGGGDSGNSDESNSSKRRRRK